MSEDTNKPGDDMDDLKDIRDLYAASQQEESPEKLDSAILKAAHDTAGKRTASRQRLRIFDPPVAIAATILLSVGLVTLVMKDVDKTTLPPSLESYPLAESGSVEKQRHVSDAQQDMSDKRDEDIQPISADMKSIAASPAMDSLAARKQEKMVTGQEAISSSNLTEEIVSAAPAPVPPTPAPEAMPIPSANESTVGKNQALYAREVPAGREQIEQLELRDELLREIQEEEAQFTIQTRAKTLQAEKKRSLRKESIPAPAMAPPLTEPEIDEDVEEGEYLADSSAAGQVSGFLAPVRRVLHNKGDVRAVTGALEVWYDENHRWVSAESFFELELKRLDGPTYGKTNEYPAYETVKEWQTLVEILPDGRECPMVFYHERWRRLADVLDLDQRLRDYGGCADVLKP